MIIMISLFNNLLDTCLGNWPTVGMESIFADPEVGRLDGLIDLDRYPLESPGSPQWLSLTTHLRDRLTLDGCVSLPGFLTPDALNRIAGDIAALAEHVTVRRQWSSVYSRDGLEGGWPLDDPRCRKSEWFAGHVTRDMIPPFAPAQRLYVSGYLKRFLAEVVGLDRVFEYADPLAGLVATIMPPGGWYPWHYDTNEFVVTIMLQPAEAGGEFQYHKDLRSPGDENLDGLLDVLTRAEPQSHRYAASFEPGDLQLFFGRYSLHRVTTVRGEQARHVLVLSYAGRPGIIGPTDRTRAVYGRVTEAHLVAEQAGASTLAPDQLIL